MKIGCGCVIGEFSTSLSWTSHGHDFLYSIRCICDSRELGSSDGLFASSSSLVGSLEAWSKTARAGIVARTHDVNTGANVPEGTVCACKVE